MLLEVHSCSAEERRSLTYSVVSVRRACRATWARARAAAV